MKKDKIKKTRMPATVTMIKRLVIRVPVTQAVALEDPRIPGAVKFMAYVSTKQLPHDLPYYNVRTPNLGASLYQSVIADLGVKDKPFHLNNRGIIALAAKAKILSGGSELEIDFSQGDGVLSSDEAGVLDGGRTYEIIRLYGKDSPEQFVPLNVMTGIPSGYKLGMATALNSSAQVKSISVLNFSGEFDFIKEELRSQPYYDSIFWEEGMKGNGKVSVSKIISLMSIMNTELYPNKMDAPTPQNNYAREPSTLKHFRSNIAAYKRQRGMIHDILMLRDYVEANGPKLYAAGGHRAGFLSFMTTLDFKRTLTFSKIPVSLSMPDGAVFMQLAALRATVRQWDNQLRWVDGSRQIAQDLYDRVGARFMTVIDRTLRESRGKDSVHTMTHKGQLWVTMHNMAQQELKEMRKV